MRLDLATISKSYILCFGIVNLVNVLPLLGILTVISPLPHHYPWYYHAAMTFVYSVLPILTVLLSNYLLYMSVSGVCLAAMLLPLCTGSLNFVSWLLSASALVLSLVLAVEDAASKASVEFLSLLWSQF